MNPKVPIISTLYLIDSRISLADRERLLASLAPDSAWAVLDEARDGISQIRDQIAAYDGLMAVHLIGHGAPGSLLMGSGSVTLTDISQQAYALAQIGTHLSPGADILVYGCNVAQGEAGAAFIEQLAHLTGADVAASIDPVGPQANWILEAHTGVIEATPLDGTGVQATLDAIGISALHTSNRKPTLSGSISLSAGRTLEVELNGKVYKVGPQLTVVGDTWTLNLDSENSELAPGNYNIQARVVDAKPAAPVLLTGNGAITASDPRAVNHLSGGSANDNLTAASRADVAVFSGERSDYEISASTAGITVRDKRTGANAQGTDTLSGLNLIQFADTHAPEFIAATALRVAMTGTENSREVNVNASKLYNGSLATETFIVAKQVSAMILAGTGDAVDFSGRLIDYSFSVQGSRLLVNDGAYTTTINVGGEVTLRTASGSYLVTSAFSSSGLTISIAGQAVNGNFDPSSVTASASTLSGNAQTIDSAVGNDALVVELSASPTLLSSTPSVNATSVSVAADISMSFSTAIKAGTGNITITDGGNDVRTIPITDPQISISGNTLTIHPSQNLWLSTQSSSGSGAVNTVLPRTYQVQLDSGAVTDLAGTPYAGISGSALSFTTASTSLTTIASTGAAANRVDIVVVGDGYRAKDIATGTLGTDVRKLIEYFFESGELAQPFGRYASYFNIHAIDVASMEKGVDMNYSGNTTKTQVNTALDAQQSSSTDRLLYASTAKAEAVASEALAGTGVTADMKVVTLNTDLYGGAGGAWASYSQGNGSLEVALHEIGHSYAGLADEYIDNNIAPDKIYTGSTEFNLPNVTIDPAATKWAAWIGQYQPGIGVIGAFDGGQYYESGVYRPSEMSKMNRLDHHFDLVTREAFVLAFYRNVDPLDIYSTASSANMSLSVLPIDPTLIDLQWNVDGLNLPVNGSTLDLSSLRAGEHTITLTARDNSGWVRDAYMNQLTQTQTWSVVVPVALSLDAGDNTYTVSTNTWVKAGDGNDAITGSDCNDRLEGEAGNDTLLGGDGDDILLGGSGINVLDGGAGINTASYQGTATPVTVTLGSTLAQQTTANSTDRLVNIANLVGGSGDDTLTGNEKPNDIQGMNGNDTIAGGEGNNILDGGPGDDVITAGKGNNKVLGGLGQDSITVGNGDNAVFGDEGNDVIIAGSGDNHIYGGAGNDLITVGSGANTIDGGDGNDTITGGSGNDIILGGTGANNLSGGGGNNTLSYNGASVAITVSLASGAAQNTGYSIDTISNFQNLIGGSGNDQLTGNANANTLQGGAGDDTLIGGAGDDIYVGGGGRDTVSFAGATRSVVANLNGTMDYATGKAMGSATGEGNDTLWQISNLVGSQYSDQLIGDSFANTLNGGGGSDALTGGAGADFFVFDGAIGGSQHAVDIALLNASNVCYITVASAPSISNFAIRIADPTYGAGPYFNIEGYQGSAHTLHGSSADGSIEALAVSLRASPSYNASLYTISAGTGANTGKLQISFNTAGGVYAKFDVVYDMPLLDHVTDFTPGSDHIVLSTSTFAGLLGNESGSLDANLYCQSPQTKTNQSRIIYDPSNGWLSYDTDGSGSLNPTLFCVLDDKPANLNATDFLIL